MTDEKFTELINSYLDKEISEDELNLLKKEIGTDSDRKRIFLERCRLHKAMSLALKLEAAFPVVTFPRWLLLSGMAACLLVTFILIQPVLDDTLDPVVETELVGLGESGLAAGDPLAKSDLRRFVLSQEPREVKDHASLISQMRLMGLRPELTPMNKQLQEVNLAANYWPKQQVNQAELFRRIQAMKAIPEQKILTIDEPEPSEPVIWTENFEPSLSAF